MKSASANEEEERSQRAAKRGSQTDLVLTDKDRKILALVQEYRFLTMDLIWRLMRDGGPGSLEHRIGKDGKKRPAKYGFGQQALYKRLNLLSKGEFLVPHRLTDRPYGGTDGSPRQVYHLGSAAVAPVAEVTGITPDDIRQLVEANKKVKIPFMRHALDISTFRAAIMLACRESQGKVEVTFWEQSSILRDSAIGHNSEGDEERYSVYPDAFFGLQVEGKGRAHYFLEADRGTMPIAASFGKPDIRKKLLGFHSYRDNKQHTSRYACRKAPDGSVSGLIVRDPNAGEFSNDPSLLPIQGFSVLFLVPGFIDRTGSPSGRLANILSAIPTFGPEIATSSSFWFTPSDSYAVERPLSVFERIWLTPNPTKGPRSLVED